MTSEMSGLAWAILIMLCGSTITLGFILDVLRDIRTELRKANSRE